MSSDFGHPTPDFLKIRWLKWSFFFFLQSKALCFIGSESPAICSNLFCDCHAELVEAPQQKRISTPIRFILGKIVHQIQNERQ
jgi:hypothetical protein